MQRKSFADMTCPIARSLEHVGEWWSMLILRDAFGGMTRFDEFQQSLGIAPNMLTRRLAALVEAGLLERRRYSERPPRDEYVLTERGRDFSRCWSRCSPSARSISRRAGGATRSPSRASPACFSATAAGAERRAEPRRRPAR